MTKHLRLLSYARGKRYATTIFMLFLVLTLPEPVRPVFTSGPQQTRIVHNPTTTLRRNQPLHIEARLDGVAPRVVYVRLYYKVQGSDSYDYIEMSRGGSTYVGEVPASEIVGNKLQYFILALVGSQQVITHPELNPYGNPIEVVISGEAAPPATPTRQRVTPPPARSQPSQPLPDATRNSQRKPATTLAETATDLDDDGPILILSPENGEEFGEGEEVLIALSFLGSGDDAVDAQSVALFVDGVNVTPEADVSENVLTYTAPDPGPGEHRIQVRGKLVSGAELPGQTWSFQVKGEARRSRDNNLAFRGRVFAETRHENISNTSFDENNIGGHIAGEYGVADYEARLYLTSREDRFSQPRHRYTFRLDLPVVGVTFGDVYPRFNDLMLWGKRVRGLHGRVHLGFFNVDVITGETARQVDPVVAVDSLGQELKTIAGTDSIATFGTHEQNLFGLRASFGGGRNFQLGFNFLKVRDDTTSLRPGEFSTFPQDNLVVGSDFLLRFLNRRVEFRAAVAMSWLTNDITGGPLKKEDIEEQFDVELPDFLDPEEIQDFLIFNSSTTPIDPRDLTSLAFNTGLRLNVLNNNLELGYKSIGSEYNSLGNAFLRNNLRGFYIQDRFRVYQNKIYLNLGFESYDDNFDADDQNPATNLQTISTGVSIYPGRGLPNLSFNLRNHSRDNGIATQTLDTLSVTPMIVDTLDNREDNTTRDVSVQLNYDTRFANLNHSISVSWISSGRNDKFVPLTENSSNVQLLSVRSVYPFPLTTTVNFARNSNDFSDGLNTFEFNMFGAKGEYRLLNDRLNTYLGINFTSASGQTFSDTTQTSLPTAISDYKRIAFTGGARFEISSGHFVMLDASLIKFDDNGATFDPAAPTIPIPNPSFTDRILRVYYEKRF